MQLTFKQLEAFVAVYDQGTFDGAARHLDLAQSAISRQIQELEQWFGFALFDRSGRTAKPNTVAHEVIPQVRAVLLRRDEFDSCLTGNEAILRKLRIGMTEFTALSWLPAIVKAITADYPLIAIEPVIDTSASLKAQLNGGRLDLIILPDGFTAEGLIKIDLQPIPNGLYCAPELLPAHDEITFESAQAHTWLTESKNSGAGMIHGDWMHQHFGKPPRQLQCNSLVALIGLALSGLGIAFLPDGIAQRHVAAGTLRKLMIQPSPAPIPYVALVRADSFSPLLRHILSTVARTCTSETLMTHPLPTLASPGH